MLIRTAIALLLLFSAAASAQDLDTAISAVVRISGTKDGSAVRGSGFVVGLSSGKATIVTASHVIEGAENLEVTFAADPTERFPVDTVFGMDTGNPHGLAAFQVRGPLSEGVTTLSFEVESRPRLGDALFLLGFPQMTLALRTTQRVLSARSGTLLLVDQNIGEGFSGGPVLQGGKVVGVVTDTDDQTTYAVNALVTREALEGWGVKLGGQSSASSMSTATQTKPEPSAAKACTPGKKISESGIDFIRICPGTFIMGSAKNDPQADIDEKPAHQVTLSEFWIGKTEVTNKQYRRYQPNHQGEDELPATSVSWIDAEAACEYFGGRLPTEAEWEYAARAGSKSAWSFGSAEKLLADYAWHDKNAGDNLHPVTTRKPNAWGLYDMYGNVWEWVADWYSLAYPNVALIDPSGPAAGEYRVLRGGSFIFPAWSLRSANRYGFWPEYKIRIIGFRCARGPRRQT